MLMRVFVATFLVASGAVACNDGSPMGCADNSACPEGHVCLNRACEQLCGVDRECAAGYYCDGDICVAGDRLAPAITNITGKGSDACVEKTGNPCLGTAIVVTGRNLGGSEFELVPELPGGTTYALATPAGGRLQDDLVDLAPASGDLEPGRYVLTATNSAGSDQDNVELLKGDPGPTADLTGTEIVNRINADTLAGKIDASHLPALGGSMTGDQIIDAINNPSTVNIIDAARVAGSGSGSGGTVYVYDDSPTATDSHSISADKMVVHLTASTTGTVSLDIDHAKLVELCGDRDGCTVSLGVGRWRNGADVIDTTLVGAPCKMFINPVNNTWAVSTACTQWYATWTPNNDGAPTWNSASPGFYAPYYTSTYGEDGTAPANVVLHNRACYFAESAPDVSPDHEPAAFLADGSPGMYLVASHPTWAGAYYVGDAFWDSDDPDRACELIIED
jgi:hypothetical protein